MMEVAVAQLNLTVGDLPGNAAKILEAWRAGIRAGARVVTTPELSLTGYAPEDLLLRRAFLSDCAETLKRMAEEVETGALLVGFPEWDNGRCYNAMALIRKRKVQAIYRKTALSVEDERYFSKGNAPLYFTEGGVKFTVLFEDDLFSASLKKAVRLEAPDTALVTHRRAYRMGDETESEIFFARAAKSWKLPMIVTQAFGGQDAKVFAGGSFAVSIAGNRVFRLPAWKEVTALVALKKTGIEPATSFNAMPAEYHVYQALVTALSDYVKKNGFSGVVLGLSGGVDSALCCAVAVDALGSHAVHTVQLPSPHTSSLSQKLATEMSELMAVSQVTIPIAPLTRATKESLEHAVAGELNDITEQNLQARCRAMLLMGLSNQHNWLLISTGNKSESATGYATLYGDMAGGFSLIKDLTKAWVYRLARYRNTLGRVIPEEVLTRAPTAELKPGQTDQDSLPPYPALDTIVEAYVERGQDAATLLDQGIAASDIENTLTRLAASEYKRRQAAPGVCMTRRAFGDDWRYPMTCRWRDNIKASNTKTSSSARPTKAAKATK